MQQCDSDSSTTYLLLASHPPGPLYLRTARDLTTATTSPTRPELQPAQQQVSSCSVTTAASIQMLRERTLTPSPPRAGGATLPPAHAGTPAAPRRCIHALCSSIMCIANGFKVRTQNATTTDVTTYLHQVPSLAGAVTPVPPRTDDSRGWCVSVCVGARAVLDGR